MPELTSSLQQQRIGRVSISFSRLRNNQQKEVSLEKFSKSRGVAMFKTLFTGPTPVVLAPSPDGRWLALNRGAPKANSYQ